MIRLLCRLWLAIALPAMAETRVPETPPTPLTSAQLEWAQGRTVRVGSDPSFSPFSEVSEDGVLHGVDARVLESIAAHTGLKFQQVRFATWSEAWTAFQNGELDVLTGCAHTPERAEHAIFTRPYASPRLAIITTNESEGGWTPADLVGHRVAVPLDYALAEDLRQRFPGTRVITTGTLREALDCVAQGTADATVINLASAVALLPDANFRHLRISGFYDREFPLRLAVRPTPENSEWLHPVLDSALNSLRPNAAVAAYTDWVDARLDEWSSQHRRLHRQRGWLIGLAATVAATAGLAGLALTRLRRREDRASSPASDHPAPTSQEPLLGKAFDLTTVPILVVKSPDLILDRNAAARAILNGAMVLPPELAALNDRLSQAPPETPMPFTWAPPGHPPITWQVRRLPLPEGRCLLTFVP